MDESKPIFPDLKWAQRKDRLFVTIDIPDCEKPVIDLKPEGRLTFNGNIKEKKYQIDLELFADVIIEESKWNLKGRNILLNIYKKDKENEYWPRLTKIKMKHPHIQVDWSKYIEEDEENEQPLNEDLKGDFDPDQMQDFNNGDYEDSDDEDEEEVETKPEEATADLDDMDAEEEADVTEKPQTADAGTDAPVDAPEDAEEQKEAKVE
jgi:prostaglandin-E synthase